jgi:hypothetical protein
MRQPLQSARAGGCTHGAASLLHMAFRLSVGSAIDRSLPGAFQVYLQEMRSCPPKTELDWDVFQPSNRSLQDRGGAKMGNVSGYPDLRSAAFRYLTRCRERILEIHAHGRCPTYQKEIAKRGVPHFRSTHASLSDTFEELRNAPAQH